MVPLLDLWLPILLSAVLVFVASSIIHMLLGYHDNEWRRVPAEDEAMDALRRLDLSPGDYVLPCAGSRRERGDPAFIEKMKKGPMVFLTIMPAGAPAMGKSLALWFVYCVVVGVFAAYVAGRALGPDAHYLAVFRFAGATAFAGYALALWQNTIWYKRSAAATLKANFDALIYALLTAGAFGWLWPS